MSSSEPRNAAEWSASRRGAGADTTRKAVTLFRSEALEHSHRRLEGEVIVAVPFSLTIFAGLIAAVIIIAGIFVASTTYSRKVSVDGWVQPSAGIIRAISVQGGVVESIDIVENAVLRVGTPVVSLKLSTDLSAGAVGELMASSVAAEQIAAMSRANAEQHALRLKSEVLANQQKALRIELEESRGRAASSAERQELAEIAYLRSSKLLSEGAYAQSRLEADQMQLLRATEESSQARVSVSVLNRQLVDIAGQIASVPLEVARNRADLDQIKEQLAQKDTNANAQTRYVVRAPISGRVLAIPIELGQTLAPGATVAVLTPEGSSLVAELFVPSKAAGFIRTGQQVRLRYHAFPHEKFGAGIGYVTHVSSTVLSPREFGAISAPSEEYVFKVRVRLEGESVQAYGQAIPLQPGMQLTANIIVETRSLWEWLFDPILAAGGRL